MTTDHRSRPAVLVTGGAGFLGSHLVSALLDLDELRDHSIVVLDDLSGGFRNNVLDCPRITFSEGSITDYSLVCRLFDEHAFHYVYHLAAYAAEGLSHFVRRFNYTNNLIGSINLINQSVLHAVTSFVFTSSIAVYGAMQAPAREDMCPIPGDPYGIAKYAVELDLIAASHMFGLDYVVFRPHNVYGENQNLGDPYRNVVALFMNQLLRGQRMTVFGDGTQQRAFTYVSDIAPTIAKAPLLQSARNQVFNIGADTPYTINHLASRVAAAMGAPNHPVVHLAARKEVHTAYADHAKLRTVFGCLPDTSLDLGLQKMARWSRCVGARSTKRFAQLEIERNMPPGWQD